MWVTQSDAHLLQTFNRDRYGISVTVVQHQKPVPELIRGDDLNHSSISMTPMSYAVKSIGSQGQRDELVGKIFSRVEAIDVVSSERRQVASCVA